jgi:hypothetical protein
MSLVLHYQLHTKLFIVPYTIWLKDDDNKSNDKNLLKDTKLYTERS